MIMMTEQQPASSGSTRQPTEHGELVTLVTTSLQEKHGWTKREVGWAMGYESGKGLQNYINGAAQFLPERRMNRMNDLMRLCDGEAKLPPPKRAVPLGNNLRAALVPTGAPASSTQPLSAPQDDLMTGSDLLAVLDACRKDVDRATNRLRARLQAVPPLLRPGLEQALQQAQALADMLTIR